MLLPCKFTSTNDTTFHTFWDNVWQIIQPSRVGHQSTMQKIAILRVHFQNLGSNPPRPPPLSFYLNNEILEVHSPRDVRCPWELQAEGSGLHYHRFFLSDTFPMFIWKWSKSNLESPWIIKLLIRDEEKNSNFKKIINSAYFSSNKIICTNL